MAYKVLKPFIDGESGAYFTFGSLFSSSNSERLSLLGQLGYLQYNEKVAIPKVDATLLEEAKALKIKGYTKMNEENLRKAIEAVKASDDDGSTDNATN